jgi:hypothetical protein
MENDLFDTIIKSFLAQMNSSLKISKIISEHGHEEKLSEDSIVTGLVYRLMNPMDNEDMEDSIETAKNIYENLYQSDSEDEDYEEIIEDLKIRKVKQNTCNCEICINARVSLLNYKNHEPKDNLEMMFKNAIDNACERGKLYI